MSYPMKCKCGTVLETEGDNIAHDCDYYPADIMERDQLWEDIALCGDHLIPIGNCGCLL